MESTTNRNGIALGVLMAIVCFVTFFVNNGVLVPDIMESRNIITAREMVYDGNWIVPTMNGELRLEKPPLPTWLTAVAELVSPDSVVLQRAMAGLAAMMLVFFFWRFARRIMRIDPLVPTLLLVTCYNIILMGRTASWDIYTHGFMMGGIYFLARALLSERRDWAGFLWAGLFIGLSIMSKGPVSLYALFLPFLISFIWAYRPKGRGRALPIAVMVLLSLAVGAWWYIYVRIVAADALGAVVQKESGSWINHNVRPWYYYWKFFLETGVWSVLMLTSIFLPLFDRQRRNARQWLFAMGWMLCALVLLSLMPEKKTRYLLPMLIPCAYVMGCMVIWWRRAFRDPASASSADKVMFRINTWLIAVVVATIPVAAWFTVVRSGFISLWFWIAITIACLAIAVWLGISAVRLRVMGLLWAVTVLFVTAEIFIMPAVGHIVNNPDRRSIEETRAMRELDGLQFYHLDTDTIRIELVYAAGRTIRPVAADSVVPVVLADGPMVLMTHGSVAEELPTVAVEAGRLVDTIPVGHFDDNRRPKDNRRYSPTFIYNVTLIRPAGGDPNTN